MVDAVFGSCHVFALDFRLCRQLSSPKILSPAGVSFDAKDATCASGSLSFVRRALPSFVGVRDDPFPTVEAPVAPGVSFPVPAWCVFSGLSVI